MKTIDKIFITFVVSLILYAQLTPGYQIMPPWWKPEDRMNFKPTIFTYIAIFGTLLYFILKRTS